MRRAALAGSLLLLAAAPAAAQTVVLRPGKVVVAPDRAPLERAALVLADGKIAAVGEAASVPEGARVIELPGAWAVAGFVDASCALSLVGDRDEVAEAIQPDVTVRPGVNPRHRDFAEARAAGVTTALIVPGDRALFGGEGALVKTTGEAWEPAAGAPVKLALGPAALVPGRAPTSRQGAVSLLRRAIAAAHAPDPAAAEQHHALGRFARGAVPGVWSLGSGLDLETAAELIDAFGLRALLRVVPELTVDELRGRPLAGRTLAFGPYRHGATTPDQLAAPAFAAAAGARVAFVSEAPATPAAGLRLSACLAAAHGLDPAAALAGLTVVPAEALGIAEQVGTLEVGKDADVVLFDGPPLALTSRVLAVYVGGRAVFVRAEEERP